MPDDQGSPLDAASLTRIYRKIRDRKAELSAEFKKQEAELDEELKQVERLLLDIMNQTGATGLKNEYGSVNKVIKERFWSTDWDEFKRFAKQHDALDLFEQRIAQKNMAAFVKQNPTLIPAGLQVDRKYAVHVVKPRTKIDFDGEQ